MTDRRRAELLHPGANRRPTMAQAHRFARKKLQRICRLSAMPPSAERDRMLTVEIARYSSSPGVKATKLRSLGGLKRLSDAAIVQRARRMNFATPCWAPVRWWYQQKRSGGYRPVCNLPSKARVGQMIVRDLLVAQRTPDHRLYDWPGRGIHRHVEAVRSAFTTAGPFAHTIDVRDCFDSVDIEAVYGLNLLPTEVIRSCIDHRHLNFRYVGDENILSLMHLEHQRIPRGLLQGGAASSALVVSILGDVFGSLPAASSPLAYADNFIVFGRDEQSADDAVGELVRTLSGRPWDPLYVHHDSGDVRDDFLHVGCLFCAFDDGVECWIPDRRLDALINKMTSNINTASDAEFARGAQFFSRRALGPYGWAADWQKQHVEEEALRVWTYLSRGRSHTS